VPYDVAKVRAHFPALAEGVAHFDGPAGSQVPDVVADAVASTLLSGLCNRGTVTAAEIRAEHIIASARQAAADLLGAQPNGIIFGRSMTQLTYDISRTLAKQWRPGDEVIVTKLDHDANIRPWVQAAEARNIRVRWAEFDRTTGEMPVEAITSLLTDRTRLVAITAASNLLGTRPSIARITPRAHEAGALVYVDGVHLTPHAWVDVESMGADFYACSPYKFLGPHLGIIAARPTLLESLRPDKLLPSPNTSPDRFEYGTLPFELLAGTTAAIDFLADLVPSTGTRRIRLAQSMKALEEHETILLKRLEDGLKEKAVIHGSPHRDRTPTSLFTPKGIPPATAYKELALRGINAPSGTFYAIECARWLKLGDTGAIRAGIAPYTTEQDVDRLIAATKEITTQGRS
jgi:cysteine desulfurase family protein (TIGR01976 family)